MDKLSDFTEGVVKMGYIQSEVCIKETSCRVNENIEKDIAIRLIQKHSAMLIKKTLSSIQVLNGKIERATNRKVELGLSASGVRSSAHWKSVASFQQCYEERERLYGELRELNDLTNFLSNLHQDRYKFIDKYQNIINVVWNKVENNKGTVR